MAKVCYIMTPAVRRYAAEHFPDLNPNEVLVLMSLYNERNDVRDWETLPPAEGLAALKRSLTDRGVTGVKLGNTAVDDEARSTVERIAATLGINATVDGRTLSMDSSAITDGDKALFLALVKDLALPQSKNNAIGGSAQERYVIYAEWMRTHHGHDLVVVQPMIEAALQELSKHMDLNPELARQRKALKSRLNTKTMRGLAEGLADWWAEEWRSMKAAADAEARAEMEAINKKEEQTRDDRRRLDALERAVAMTDEQWLAAVGPGAVFKSLHDRLRKMADTASDAAGAAAFRELSGNGWIKDKASAGYVRLMRRRLRLVLDEGWDFMCNETCKVLKGTELLDISMDMGHALAGKAKRGVAGDEDGDGDPSSPEEGMKETWMYHYATVSGWSKLPVQMRKLISGCWRHSPDGKLRMGPLGHPERLTPGYVYPQLLKAMRGIRDSRKVVERLEGMCKDDRTMDWAGDIAAKLAQDPQLLTMFYDNFRRTFKTYGSFTRRDDGTIKMYVTSDDNSGAESAMTMVKNVLKSHMTLADGALYDDGGNILQGRKDAFRKRVRDLKAKFKDARELDESGKRHPTYENGWDWRQSADLWLDMHPEAVDEALDLMRCAGFSPEREEVEALLYATHLDDGVVNALDNIALTMNRAYKDVDDDGNTTYRTFKTVDEFVAKNEGLSALHALQDAMRLPSDESLETSYRFNGKSYYAYALPSDMDDMAESLSDPDLQARRKYIDATFGRDRYYKSPRGRWMSRWLASLYDGTSNLETMELRQVRGKDGSVTEFKDWTKADRARLHWDMWDVRRHRYGDSRSSNPRQHPEGEHWYPIPVPSDNQIARYVRFTSSDDIDGIAEGYASLIEQEVARMCNTRSLKDMPDVYVKNQDRFMMLPQLNGWKGRTGRQTADELSALAKSDSKAYRARMLELAKELLLDECAKWVSGNPELATEIAYGAADAARADELARALSSLFSDRASLTDAMRRIALYVCDSSYAQSQMVELFVGDPAFFKDYADLQKRFKQTIVPKNPVDVFNKDANPDQREALEEKCLYLDDVVAPSKAMDDIKRLYDRKLKEGLVTRQAYDNVMAAFSEIKYTDGQGYRTPAGLRRLLFMQGLMKGGDELDVALSHVFEGTDKQADLDVILRHGVSFVQKPFVSGDVMVDAGGGRMKRMPVQHKYSEQLLAASLKAAAVGRLSTSPALCALRTFTEKHGIDVVLFNSAVKEGNNGYATLVQPERGFKAHLNITSNAGGRNGAQDTKDAGTYEKVVKGLRDHPDDPALLHAMELLRSRRKAEMERAFDAAFDGIAATAKVDTADGSWEGGGEYSFVVEVTADSEDEYAKAIEAASYVAEHFRQDAFIESWEVDRNAVMDWQLIDGTVEPAYTITVTAVDGTDVEALTESQRAALIGMIEDERKSTGTSLDFTLSGNTLQFIFLPDLDERLSDEDRYKQYKEQYNEWLNNLKRIYDERFNTRQDGLPRHGTEGLYRGESSQHWLQSRFHAGVQGTQAEVRSRDYSEARKAEIRRVYGEEGRPWFEGERLERLRRALDGKAEGGGGAKPAPPRRSRPWTGGGRRRTTTRST